METSEPLMMADGFYEKNVGSVSFFMRVASKGELFSGSECCWSSAGWFDGKRGVQNGPGGVVSMTFHSILFARTEDSVKQETREAPAFFVDLNLDQIIDAITAGRQEYNLKPFFYTPLHNVDAITYRHAILRDLEHPLLFEHLQAFAQKMRVMREQLAQADKLYYTYQKDRWFVDAVETYCDAVTCLVHDLTLVDVHSRGFVAFRDYITDYANSGCFPSLLAETKQLKAELSTVKYCLLIKGNRIKVRTYDSERDYSAAVEETFAKFKQGAVKDYRVKFRNLADMDHVEARILDLVARLYPDIFSHLADYCAKHGTYLDETIAVFDREIQFYLYSHEGFPHVSRS